MGGSVIVGLALLGWNLIVFLLYAVDKWKARSGRWRISEAALLTCTFLLGAPGAAFGMAVVLLCEQNVVSAVDEKMPQTRFASRFVGIFRKI